MSRRLLALLSLSALLLCAPGQASAGLFSKGPPARPEVHEQIHQAKLHLVAGRRAEARKLAFGITVTNKAEKKAVEALHLDVLRSHITETNAYLRVGKIEQTARSILEIKQYLQDAYTLHRAELTVTLPVDHPRYPTVLATMNRLESQQGARAK